MNPNYAKNNLCKVIFDIIHFYNPNLLDFGGIASY